MHVHVVPPVLPSPSHDSVACCRHTQCLRPSAAGGSGGYPQDPSIAVVNHMLHMYVYNNRGNGRVLPVSPLRGCIPSCCACTHATALGCLGPSGGVINPAMGTYPRRVWTPWYGMDAPGPLGMALNPLDARDPGPHLGSQDPNLGWLTPSGVDPPPWRGSGPSPTTYACTHAHHVNGVYSLPLGIQGSTCSCMYTCKWWIPC